MSNDVDIQSLLTPWTYEPLSNLGCLKFDRRYTLPNGDYVDEYTGLGWVVKWVWNCRYRVNHSGQYQRAQDPSTLPCKATIFANVKDAVQSWLLAQLAGPPDNDDPNFYYSPYTPLDATQWTSN